MQNLLNYIGVAEGVSLSMLAVCLDRYKGATNCTETLLADVVTLQAHGVDVVSGWNGWRTVRGLRADAVPLHLCLSELDLLNSLGTGRF